MPLAWELLLKVLVLASAVLAVGGAALLFGIGLLANGSAISNLDFSWSFFAWATAISVCQVWLAVAGCRSAWRWIDRWSLEIAEARAAMG